MSEKQETVTTTIPKDYCIMRIKVAEGDITEIGIAKVRNNHIITSYLTEIKPTIEDIDKTMSRVLEIIGTDTIFYINTRTDIELLKQKCESMQIPITNELISNRKVLEDIGTNQRDFVCNVLEVVTKI